jgi:hypothetical protein
MFDEITSITTSIDASGRIQATVTAEDFAGETFTREYRTSPCGDGLWMYTGKGEYKQLLGTGQFSATSRRQMRDKLRRKLSAA